jgi:hypothetical protein
MRPLREPFPRWPHTAYPSWSPDSLRSEEIEQIRTRLWVRLTTREAQAWTLIERTETIRCLPGEIGEWTMIGCAHPLLAERERMGLRIDEQAEVRAGGRPLRCRLTGVACPTEHPRRPLSLPVPPRPSAPAYRPRTRCT